MNKQSNMHNRTDSTVEPPTHTPLIRTSELRTPRFKGRQMWAPIDDKCIFPPL